MFKNILVPYDEYECARRAFGYALDMAIRYSSALTVITCIHRIYGGHPYSDSREEEALFKLQRTDALKAISKLEMKAKQSGIALRTTILEAISVSDELLSYAKSHKIDLIVMGSRGLGGFKKLLQGSVATTVSQHAECPVLIVK